MTNPYEAPRSAVPSEPIDPARAHLMQRAISIVIAVICTLYFWSVMLPAIRLVLVYHDPAPPILQQLLRPTLLFVSGVFLLFARKLATYTFAAYSAWTLMTLPDIGRSGAIASLLMVCAMLAYTLHLHKAGRLR